MKRAASALAVLLAGMPALAAPQPERPDVWAIRLGAQVGELPRSFADFACGTRGGPPAAPLGGFGQFARCAREADGLHEVYFRYDDELEYWARANNLAEAERYAGTTVYNFPVVLSVLVDDGGRVRGLRIVSDPRERGANRERAYQLANFINGRFGQDGWACTDQPPQEGETPVFGVLVKRHCEKTAQYVLTLDIRHLRKPGQAAIDPVTGHATQGQFESETRFEMRLRE